MAKPRNIDELIHAWAQDNDLYASCGNVRSEGPRLYSYAECIAQLLPNNAVVFTTRHWSPTTASHLSAARRATNGRTVVWAYGPHWTPGQNRELVEHNIAQAAGRIPNPVMKKDGKTETFLSKKRRAEATHDILRTVQKFNEYLTATGDETVQPIPEPNIEDMKQAMQELARREEERRQEEQRKKDEASKGLLQKWRKHDTTATSVGTSAPALRMSKDGEWVETSWGARVPVADALLLWPMIMEAKSQNREVNISRRTLMVGNYVVNQLRADGTLVVGCHTIAYSEIEGIAVELGLKEKAHG